MPAKPILSPIRADAASIAEAAAYIRGGRLAAFPTETVYGLGGDAGNRQAVAAIFAAKARPRFNPLIIHAASAGHAAALGQFSASAEKLAAHFWPGALSLVVPRIEDAPVADLACAGLSSLALRVPAHPVARALLREAGCAIAAPSANRAGRLSITRASDIAGEFAGRDEPAMILDGGQCALGLESTIISCLAATPMLLREGAIPAEEIAEVLGASLAAAPAAESGEAARLSPGRLLAHYAPSAKLRLNALDIGDEEVLLAFGGTVPRGAKAVCNLSPSGDINEAAANFFTMLRALDALAGSGGIAVMPIPRSGLGAAINDRLKRAAAGAR